MKPILVVMGAGQRADGDLLGLKKFFADRRILIDPAAHDDADLDRIIDVDYGGAVCHSFGGYELLQRIPRMKRLPFLLALDPKPNSWAWWNLAYQFPLPVPAPGVVQCLYSWFGCSFIRGAFSTKLSIGHANFPSDPRVQQYLELMLAHATLADASAQLHTDSGDTTAIA